jgi:hypothetical protein
VAYRKILAAHAFAPRDSSEQYNPQTNEGFSQYRYCASTCSRKRTVA